MKSILDSIGIKRKSTEDLSSSSKRLLKERYDALLSKLNHPIQIGQYLYVPIPIIDDKPLDLSKPKSTREEKFYQCKFCLIKFRSLKTLNAHEKTYCNKNQNSYLANKSIFKCTICSAMFNNETRLLDHIEYVHTDEKLLQCLECRSKFCSKWNLIQHMKLLHTNIKYDEQNLLNLKKIFSCPFCPIQFRNIETLKQHIVNYCPSRLTNNIVKDKLTFCSTCQISFQHKTSFDAHKMYYCRDRINSNIKILT